MTLGEGKNKVYMLLDEHSSGGAVEHDPDLEAKMAYFFDIAQKQVARVRRIVRTAEVTRTAGVTEYAPPADFGGLCRVWRDGEPARYRWRAGKLCIPADDGAEKIELEYYAVPATIDGTASDDTPFEVDGDAAQAMPFFVAAQQLASDLVTDSSAMLTLYNLMLSGLSSRPEGGAGLPRQSLYRG